MISGKLDWVVDRYTSRLADTLADLHMARQVDRQIGRAVIGLICGPTEPLAEGHGALEPSRGVWGAVCPN